MESNLNQTWSPSLPAPAAVLELFKPITWFPPMWAFMCGAVSAGQPLLPRLPVVLGGILLAGPLVCATSQAVNDWFDRHVDAINEPNRPIPSGRIPGSWGLIIAIVWTMISAAVASLLGQWVFWAALLGLFLSWAYSAPPLRFKQSGVLGPAAVGLSYEGITWFTGAACMSGGLPSTRIIALALLYSIGAWGIMTFNDFKAVDGDRQMGLRSLPVTMGVDGAALLACGVMALPQVLVIALLVSWGHPWFALAILVSLVTQLGLMGRLLSDPRKFAPWFNATGTSLSVLGMLVAAFAVAR
jgi:chlorophyll synthase